MRDVLKIQDIDKYFNSGVMLFDLKRLRNLQYESELVKVAKINNKYMHDQNVLNSVLQNDYLRLSSRWNYLWQIRYKYKDYNLRMPDELLLDYNKARENPGIVHYLSSPKPWHGCNWEFSELFWKYAKDTPLKDLIMSITAVSVEEENIRLKKELKSIKESKAYIIVKDIIDYNKRDLNKEIALKNETLTKENKLLGDELKSVKDSFAYRIGSAIVWLPKQIVDRKNRPKSLKKRL
jgi:lipopolysaccharide biosynthesis glycosyltransferase